ncbi:melanoma-associated antigen 10-like, partial [Nycticebus coucang]|uniref:melanoma-associated antigen 10-like n=1 Tax=Nycticebus coucang TaxID=9470 RepID=UPI00234D8994
SSSSSSSPSILVSDSSEEEEFAAENLSPPHISSSICSSSISWSISDEEPNNQKVEESLSSLQSLINTEYFLKDPLEEKVTDLVHFLIVKYRSKEPITKEEMLQVVAQSNSQFPVILNKASKCLQVIFGIDVEEVDLAGHSYALVNSLNLTYEMLGVGDNPSMPKNGLLIIVLGVIFIEGNCASEESIWDFLNMMGLYAGSEHFIYGEPRKLITVDWVQENYLEYRQVPYSDPPHYEFLWGPRAHAETSKMKVLEFLARVQGSDPTSFSSWYEEALIDEQERAQAEFSSGDSDASTSTAEYWSEASPRSDE